MMVHASPTIHELEQHVHLCTSRRVRQLSIEFRTERVVLHGVADTYYVKQLAQHGVRNLLPEACLDNAIVVAEIN